MARRIRWQIVVAAASALLIGGLLGRLALLNTTVASPLSGGSYAEALIGAPAQVIPLLNDPLADPAGRSLGSLIFDGLTRIGADGLPEPALAADWDIDETGEAYTFMLRRGVRWHDGQPFTADDVVFTLRAVQEGKFGDNPALIGIWQGVLVDRVDDYTVRCTLPAPYAPFLSAARIAMLPAHLFGAIPPDEWASAEISRRPVGTGPYRLLSLDSERALLEANPDYFLGRPFIDRFELRFTAAVEAAVGALLRGDVQAVSGRGLATLNKLDLPPGMLRASVPLDEYVALSFNLREPPLDNQALRQALARGLDKDLLVATAMGDAAVPLDTPILPGWWAADPEARWYPYDPAAAERALTEMGYERGANGVRARDGQPLALTLLTDDEPGRLAAAEALARQWAALGVRIEVQRLDAATLGQRLQSRDFQLALHGWARLGPDPDVHALWHSSQAATGLNYAGLRDEEIDILLDSARAESELALRSADYAAFQQRWIELVPSITLYQPLYTFIYNEQLGGLSFIDAQNGAPLLIGREDRYRNVSRWFLNSAREIRDTLRP